jgi:putative addiction module killer protein
MNGLWAFVMETLGRALKRASTGCHLGNFGNCSAAKEGVIELCIDFGPGYRVYFGRDGNTLVVLLGGGKKDTQDADMKLARKYWRDYKHAQKN